MNRAPAMGNEHVLMTVLMATATMPHRLTAWKVEKKTELRVYQGVDDVNMKYPYVVILYYPKRACTGSLITPEWVLTAAHCRKPSYIQYGNLSISLNVTDSKSEVIDIEYHPRNDIALLLVSPAVRLDKYGTLSAVDYSTLLGLSAEFVGGGLTFVPKGNPKTLWKLYALHYRQRPFKIGQGVVSPCEPINYKGLICVSPRCSIKQLTMPGDSGGPLLVDNNIVGVSKGGPGPWNYFLMTSDRHFTPISPHQDWIHIVITSYGDQSTDTDTAGSGDHM